MDTSQLMTQLKKKIENKEAKVAVVGFGYIGTCIGAVIADKGYQVVGIDVRRSIVEELNLGKTSINEPGLRELISKVHKSKKLTASHDFESVGQADVIVVTVGTPLGPDFTPDTRDIIAATEALARNIKDGQLVILKSTVPPGTTENVVKTILERTKKKVWVSFSPERLAEGRAIAEFCSIPVVVGGFDPLSAELSSFFWKTLLGVETIIVDNARTAEMVKLSDNLWIDLNIALANEVAVLCSKLGVDALQVIHAANSLPKGQHHVNILAPSLGVGGYCLTKDPWFVHHLGERMGLKLKTPTASRTINDQMPSYSFSIIEEELKGQGKSLKNCKVGVLGISFKNNTGDCRFTPTKPILEKLEASGCALKVFDPWVGHSDALTVTSVPLVDNFKEVVEGADCVAFLAGHDEFKRIEVEALMNLAKPGAVIFDGRNLFDRKKIETLKNAGFKYRGIGR